MSNPSPTFERQQSQAEDDDADDQESSKKKEEEREDEEVHEKSAPGAHIVYKAILLEAEEELERPAFALACSGLAAGLSMGFSLVTEGILQSRLPDAHWAALVAKIGYTFGFVIVIFARQQLFTENTLTPVLSLLKERDFSTFKSVARLWSVVLATNLIGAALIAYALQRTTAFSETERAAFLKISSEAMEPQFSTLFIKSIFAGWLIALMVWMLPVAESGRLAVLILLPYIVGLGQLSHIVIGSVYCIYTVAAHHHTWLEYLGHFAVPTLLGNCIGGVVLVAVVNYGQSIGGGKGEGTGAEGGFEIIEMMPSNFGDY